MLATTLRQTGGGGSPAPTSPVLRGSGIQSASSATFVVTWPVGTIAGDMAIIWAENGFDINLQSGWNSVGYVGGITGGVITGYAISRVLTAGDISTGSVTITPGGTFNGVVSIVTVQAGTFEGDPFMTQLRVVSGVTSSTLYGTAISTNDLMVYFGSNRGTSNNTCSLGSQLQQINATNASGCIYSENPANLTPTPVFSYSSAGSGTAECAVCVPASGRFPSWVRGATSNSWGNDNANTPKYNAVSVRWPIGTVATDVAVIFYGGAYTVASLSGWTALDTNPTAFMSGSVFVKTLDATDITNGGVSITTAAGSFDTNYTCVVVKNTALVGFSAAALGSKSVNATGSASINLSYTSSTTADLVLFYGSYRVDTNGARIATSSLGTRIVAAGDSVISSCVAAGNPASVGSIQNTFTYGNGAAGIGNYQAIVMFAGP